MLRKSSRCFFLSRGTDRGQQTKSTGVIDTGSRKVTSLVVDFLAECADYHKIRFHAPVLFGLRQHIGLRGIYLAEGYTIKRNRPIFTVPYSGMLTAENVTKQPGAPQVTLQDVEDTIVDDELRPMATHLLFGIHMACQTAHLPKHETTTNAQNKEAEDNMTKQEYERRLELFTGGIMPWARMLDDENWSEEHVLGMHRGSLDKWQLQDYTDLFNMFNRNVTELHTKLKLQCSADDLRRISRVVTARTEQVPLESHLRKSRLQRRVEDVVRKITKTPPPKPELRMVPMLDMINHSNRANVWTRTYADGTFLGVPGPCVAVYALNQIEGGQELCRFYNFGMGRGTALFRYGFLPFEMLALENFDPWKEHYAKSIAPNLQPETPEEAQRRAEIDEEVQKLQAMWKGGDKKKKQNTPSSDTDTGAEGKSP